MSVGRGSLYQCARHEPGATPANHAPESAGPYPPESLELSPMPRKSGAITQSHDARDRAECVPHIPVERPSMQQQDSTTRTGCRHIQRDSVRLNESQVNLDEIQRSYAFHVWRSKSSTGVYQIPGGNLDCRGTTYGGANVGSEIHLPGSHSSRLVFGSVGSAGDSISQRWPVR